MNDTTSINGNETLHDADATAAPTDDAARARPCGILEAVSLAFLFLPWFIFIIGYLRYYVAVPLLVTTAGSLFATYRDLRTAEVPTNLFRVRGHPRRLIHLGLAAFIVLLVVFYSGIGGFAPQVPDYTKHNALLKDLIEFPWPVAYGETEREGVNGPLAYYLFYYLTPAAVGKLTGWAAASVFSVLWVAVGVGAAAAWFLRIVGRMSIGYVLLFLFFGGLDLIGWLLLNGWPDPVQNPLNRYLSPYMAGIPDLRFLNLLYASHYNNLVWVPQHVLATWLVTAMLMHSAIHGQNGRSIFFIAAAMPLWSPFGAVGVLPLAILTSLQIIRIQRKKWISGIKELLSFQNVIAGPLLVIVAALFLQASQGGYPHGFLWEHYNTLKLIPVLLIFYLIEFGVYVLVMPRVKDDLTWKRLRPWLWAAVAMLLLIPMYRLSVVNDFIMRVSIPPLFVLAACLAYSIAHAKSRWAKVQAVMLVALLVIGAASSVQYLGLAMLDKTGFSVNPEPRYFLRMTERGLNPRHFFGDADSFFYSRLARPLEYQPARFNTVVQTWDFTNEPGRAGWTFSGKANFSSAGVSFPVTRDAESMFYTLDQRVGAPDVLGARVVYTIHTPEGIVMNPKLAKLRFMPAPASVKLFDFSYRPFTHLGGQNPATARVRLLPVWTHQKESFDTIGIKITTARPPNAHPPLTCTIHRFELIK